MNRFPKHQRIPVPSKTHLRILHFLIFIGVVLLLHFFYWYFFKVDTGQPFLFWLLTFAFGYKVLEMLYEWYYFASIKSPEQIEPQRQWSVDMLTTYVPGEPYDMVIETLTAMVKVHYPHKTYLCDEGNDPYLKQICSELGVVHVYRGVNKKGAKAGNINYALQHHATGEICIILDPDHVPVPEFIDRVIPYFEDPQIGYVQCIQGYSNYNESIVAKGAAQQTYLFYGPIMMGMNKRGTVQAIGANCTFRREALDSIGGHALGLCEDMHTSMQLHAKKWKSVYVPELLTRGRVPSSLSAYFQQQLKWTRGCFELLFEVYPRLFFKFNWTQRLHYLLTPLYFFYGVIALIDLGIPIFSLFSSSVPLFIEFKPFLIHALPLILSSITIRHYVQHYVLDQHERGFYTFGGMLRLSTWWVYLIGFFYSIIRVKVPYLPTPKETELRNDWKLSIPNIAVMILSIIAVIYGLNRDSSQFSWIMASFAITNVVVLGTIVLAAQQKMIFRLIKSWREGGLAYLRSFLTTLRHKLIYRLIRNPFFALSLNIVILGNVLAGLWGNSLFYDGENNSKASEKKLGWLLNAASSDQDFQEISAAQFKQNKQTIQETKAFSLSGINYDALQKCHYILSQCKDQQALPYIHWEISTNDIAWDCIGTSDEYSIDTNQFIKKFAELFKSYQKPLVLNITFTVDRIDTAFSYPQREAYQLFYKKLEENGSSNVSCAWQYSDDIYNDFPGRTYIDIVMCSIKSPKDLNSIAAKIKQWNLPILLITAENNKLLTSQLPKLEVPLIGIWKGIDYESTQSDSVLTFRELQLRILPEKNYLTDNDQSDHLVPKEEFSTGIIYDPEKKIYKWIIQDQPFYVKGVVFNPEHEWQDGKWPLTRRRLEADFQHIKAMGANTITWYKAPFYNRNVLKIAKESHLKVLYGFSLDSKIDYWKDTLAVADLKRDILNQVHKYNDESVIIGWILGSDTWHALEDHFHQPYLTKVREAYVTFIQDISKAMKERDSQRPIILSIDGGNNMAGAMEVFSNSVSSIDIVGLNIYQEAQFTQLIKLFPKYFPNHPYLINEFGVKKPRSDHHSFNSKERLDEPSSYEKARHYSKLWSKYIEPNRHHNLGGLAYCWRDRFEGTATLSGIMDFKGRLKPTYYALKENWTGNPQSFPIKDLKLMVQASYNHNEQILCYSVNTPPGSKLHYEWYVCENECLDCLANVSVTAEDMQSFNYTWLQNLFREHINQNFYLERGGKEFRYYTKKANALQRIYLHVYDNQGNVVTTSYPIYAEKNDEVY